MGVYENSVRTAAGRGQRLARRVTAAVLLTTAVTAGVVLTSVSVANADSPNPTSGNGTVAVNPDGSITVTLNGTWDWQRGNWCFNDRWAAGWEIDWNDPAQPGHVVGTLNGVTYDVGAQAVPGALNPADNTVDFYNGANRCGSRAVGADRDIGNWGPMVHTYPRGTTRVEPCVVTYDIHEDKGAAKVADLVAGGAGHNDDNSIQKNSAAVNICFPISVPLPPKLTLVKSVDNSRGGSAGADAFTLTATGPGGVAMTGKSGTADVSKNVNAGTYTLSESTVAGYVPDAQWICSGGSFTAPNTITLANATPAQDVTCTIWNRFVPAAPPTTPPPGAPPTTPPPAAPPTAPGIRIVKRVNGVDANTAPGVIVSAGSLLVFTYEVSNTGNTALTGVAVSDDRGLAVTCPATTLAVGASMVCTAVGTAPASGQYTNVGTAVGTPPSGTPVSANDVANAFVAAPGVDIVKSVNGADANASPGPVVTAGSPVLWAYRVRNTGNVDLTNVVVSDDKGVTVDCGGGTNTVALLRIGEERTCAASGIAIEGEYRNIGVVSATPPTGPPVTDTDPAIYTGTPAVAPPTVPPLVLPPGTLPPTGSMAAGFTWAALGLSGVGALLIVVTRRRRAV